jgi:hypothetical protein
VNVPWAGKAHVLTRVGRRHTLRDVTLDKATSTNRGSVKRYLIAVAALIAVTALAAVAGIVVAVAVQESAPREQRAISRGVYVVSTTTGDVIKIDPATRHVSETIQLGAAYLSSIAIAGEYLYYASSGGASPEASIGRYNLSTGENEPTFIDQPFYAPFLRTSPKEPEVLFVGERGLSPANIQKWSVPSSGEEPSLLTRTEHGPMGSNLQDFEISDDGAKIWSACGAPYDFLELNASDLRLSGRLFPAVPYPNSVDSVSVGGTEYLLGGTNSTSDPSIHLYRTNNPASDKHYGTTAAGTDKAGAVALASDASKIYRVVTGEQGQNASIEMLSADTGGLLATTPVRVSQYFADAIQADPASGRVFVSLDDVVGVLGGGRGHSNHPCRRGRADSDHVVVLRRLCRAL